MQGTRMELSEQEKERIINDSLPFIKHTAYRLAHRLPPQLSVSDLVSVGIVGLLDALQRYTEGRVKLSTFTEHRIRGAMLDELRSHDWLPRSVKTKIGMVKKAHRELEQELGRMPDEEEIAGRLGITLDEYFRTMESASSAAVFSFEDCWNTASEEGEGGGPHGIRDPDMKTPLELLEESSAKEALAGLIESLPEKEKLVLSLYYWEELTMKEIGKVMRLTEGRVCQLRNQALIRLKARMSAPEQLHFAK